eukprot:CAMPEP_0181296936 /NCGR_PEP_ID=MMETSP1101-20121128/4967_1 /TAXON_ID=46948 /ORGANISM="Rhodomonas abbreviata, Strain Caron Lab Isolate" /LENGTH=196 /DNA_ID=CAMNT_0023401829 /DNA_START=543 /DNA_END=1129 /DNA_ORIENTATION=+
MANFSDGAYEGESLAQPAISSEATAEDDSSHQTTLQIPFQQLNGTAGNGLPVGMFGGEHPGTVDDDNSVGLSNLSLSADFPNAAQGAPTLPPDAPGEMTWASQMDRSNSAGQYGAGILGGQEGDMLGGAGLLDQMGAHGEEEFQGAMLGGGGAHSQTGSDSSQDTSHPMMQMAGMNGGSVTSHIGPEGAAAAAAAA